MADQPELTELEHTGAEFLITDIDTAMVFLEVAETSKTAETVTRNRDNARRAYDIVLHLLTTAKLNEVERETINTKLALLKERLEAAGQQFCDLCSLTRTSAAMPYSASTLATGRPTLKAFWSPALSTLQPTRHR